MSTEEEEVMSAIYTTIVTTSDPNMDKLLALWILLYFGRGEHTLAADYAYEVYEQGVFLPENFPHKVYIDCGGGEFDGHGDNAEFCAAMLVARELGVDQDPRIKHIIDVVQHQDKEGRGKKRREIATLISHAYMVGRSFEGVRDWSFQLFDALYAYNVKLMSQGADPIEAWSGHQRLLTTDVGSIFEDPDEGAAWVEHGETLVQHVLQMQKDAESIAHRDARVHYCDRPGSRNPLRILTMNSNSPFCLSATIYGKMGDIFISRLLDKGTTMIKIPPRASAALNIDLYDVIARLRFAELQKRTFIELQGVTDSSDPDEKLRLEDVQPFDPSEDLHIQGTHQMVPQWHLHEGMGFLNIYNRTLQRLDVDPTVLTNNEIIAVITDALTVPSAKTKYLPKGRSKVVKLRLMVSAGKDKVKEQKPLVDLRKAFHDN